MVAHYQILMEGLLVRAYRVHLGKGLVVMLLVLVQHCMEVCFHPFMSSILVVSVVIGKQ